MPGTGERQYRRRGDVVTAVQFRIADKPWPFGILLDPKSGAYTADIGSPMRCRVRPGDWLVTYDDKHRTTVRVAEGLFPIMYEPLLKGD